MTTINDYTESIRKSLESIDALVARGYCSTENLEATLTNELRKLDCDTAQIKDSIVQRAELALRTHEIVPHILMPQPANSEDTPPVKRGMKL